MKILHSSLALSIFVAGALAAHGQNFLRAMPNASPGAPVVDPMEMVLKQADLASQMPYVCVTGTLVPVPPTPNAPPPAPGELPKQLPDIEAMFKMTERKFGNVTVFAPAMMTILSVDIPAPDIYADLSAQEAFKLLAASLSDDQWKALSSDQGLSDEDLTSDSQHGLWKAALHLPEKILLHKQGDIWKPNEGLDVTDKQSQFRLHLQRHIDVEIPISANNYSLVDRPDVSKSPKYIIQNTWQRDKSLVGFKPRQEVPNEPKASDLDYAASKFNSSVSMAKTPDLGTLLLRIGLRTKTEIYSDVRMAKFHVVMAPLTGSIRAGNLLQALAFAVTGTYRKVGPAYILTNDIMGLGTKTAILANFRQSADSLRHKPLDEAGDIIGAKHSMWALPLNGSPELDLTPEQHKLMAAPNSFSAANPNFGFYTAKLSDLTPAQRASAQASYDSMIKNPQQNTSPRIDGMILVNTSPTLRMTIPDVDGDVILENIYLGNLFDPSDDVRNKRYEEIRKAQGEAAKKDSPTKTNPEPTATLFQQFVALSPRRAIVAIPTSVSDAKDIVEKARALGFNQIWISVFSPGLSDDVYTSGRLSANEIETITMAARLGAARGIAVFVHLGLLNWPKSTPADIRDIDILGEDSAAASVRQSMQSTTRTGQPYAGPLAKDMTVSVNPMAPQVQKVLLTVHKQLANIPGIAGIVWSDTGSSGYVHRYNGGDEMGYPEPVRLAYVRKAQVDPVDIVPNNTYTNVDMAIPVMSQDYQTEIDVQQDWKKFRANAVDNLLRALRIQVNSSSLTTSLPKTFLVAERSGFYQGWIGSWDSMTASMPIYHQSREDGQSSNYPNDAAKQARMESQINFAKLRFWPQDDYEAMVASGKELLSTSKWDGVIVYDDVLTHGNGAWGRVDNSIETMNKLMDSLSSKSVTPAMAVSDHAKKVK